MTERLAVIVVAHNSAGVVDGLLDSLPAALDGLEADVVVVDNASVDDTRQTVAARTDARLVEAANLGYAAGINTGVRSTTATGPVVVLNPDLRLEPGCLRVLTRTLEDPHIGIAVPRLLHEDRSLAPSIRREPTLLRAAGLGFTGVAALSEPDQSPESHGRTHVVDWATGAAMVVRRECYDALGGWDETFFLYSEETDFCLRARDAGYLTLFAPGAAAVHIGGQSGGGPRIYSMQILNRVRLYGRRHGRVASWSFFAVAAVREFAWSVRGSRDSRAALATLLLPRRRPVELGCSGALFPR